MEVSEHDKMVLDVIRKTVDDEIRSYAELYDKKGVKILDIAPQDHAGAKKYFINSTVFTLDIDPRSGANFVADLCISNERIIPDEMFDYVICTEVLEHTLDPFGASAEIYRVLKKEGKCLVTTPFDFRIHGPLPDCWRFTQFGLQQIFKKFAKIEITPIENPGRYLMPYQFVTKLTK